MLTHSRTVPGWCGDETKVFLWSSFWYCLGDLGGFWLLRSLKSWWSFCVPGCAPLEVFEIQTESNQIKSITLKLKTTTNSRRLLELEKLVVVLGSRMRAPRSDWNSNRTKSGNINYPGTQNDHELPKAPRARKVGGRFVFQDARPSNWLKFKPNQIR